MPSTSVVSSAAASPSAPDRPSRTAEYMALFRALESARPADERLFEDPYARLVLRGGLRVAAEAARIPPIRAGIERLIDRRWPGPRSSGILRTRVIDDAVTRALGAGAKQLVLLGTGFDSRGYRLAHGADVRVFELDLPATARLRLQRLASARAERRAEIHALEVDLRTEPVDAVLARGGFDRDERAVVVWEGVTNYLDAAAVDSTLRGLAAALANGSTLVFTYVDAAALDGSRRFAEADRWSATVAAAGEPFTFGLVPSELPAYLGERGFRLDEDISTAAAAARFLPERRRRRDPGSELYRVVTAQRSADGGNRGG